MSRQIKSSEAYVRCENDSVSIVGTTVTVNSSDIVTAQTTVTKTTGSLADLAEETGTITSMGKSARVLITTADRECRIRLYPTAALRTADSARALGTAVAAGDTEPVLEVNPVAGDLTVYMSPVPIVYNADGTPAATIYYAIQNRSGGASTVQVDFTIIILEA